MLPEPDGEETAEIAVATQAFLCSRGFDFRHAFAICIVRVDGERFDMVTDTAEKVAILIDSMNPARVDLSCLPGESIGATLAHVATRLAPATLH